MSATNETWFCKVKVGDGWTVSIPLAREAAIKQRDQYRDMGYVAQVDEDVAAAELHHAKTKADRDARRAAAGKQQRFGGGALSETDH